MMKIFNEILSLADNRERPFDLEKPPSLYEVILEYISSSHWKILSGKY